jgi:hypothetical protein
MPAPVGVFFFFLKIIFFGVARSLCPGKSLASRLYHVWVLGLAPPHTGPYCTKAHPLGPYPTRNLQINYSFRYGKSI